MSWSRNCPYCISISVYLPWRCETSAWTTMDTRRGLGRALPSWARNRGREMAAAKPRKPHLHFLWSCARIIRNMGKVIRCALHIHAAWKMRFSPLVGIRGKAPVCGENGCLIFQAAVKPGNSRFEKSVPSCSIGYDDGWPIEKDMAIQFSISMAGPRIS